MKRSLRHHLHNAWEGFCSRRGWWCAFHCCYERVRKPFRTCGECWHSWRTQRELYGDCVAAWMNAQPELGDIPAEPPPELALQLMRQGFCPLCCHDF